MISETGNKPPDNIPRSLHDIWWAGYEAAQAERPMCRVHNIPKVAHYFCNECRKAGENVVILLGADGEA